MLNSFQHLTASLYLPPSLGEILKQVQDDFGRFLLFLHSFWGSQFNTSVEKVHYSRLTTHRSKFLKQAWYFAHLIVLWRAAEGTTVDFVFLLLTRHKMPVIFCTCFVRRFGNPQASLVFRSLNRTFAYDETIYTVFYSIFGLPDVLHGTWRL